MTTPQRIEQLVEDYRSSHYNAPGAEHPAIKRRLDRDIDSFTDELNALLLQIQDEQKEEMLSELEDVVSKAQFDWEYAYYIIKESKYAYNPKEKP